MDVGAINAAAAASSASYRSFADATRSVLDLLERLLPGCALYLSHLDRAHSVHRIVDTRARRRARPALQPRDAAVDSYDMAMADERAPRLCNDVAADPVYAELGMQRRAGRAARTSACRSSCPTARASARSPRCPSRSRASAPDDEQLFGMLARVLAYELERESNERDLRRLNDSLRDHARGMGAIGRVVRVLAGGDDARRAVCRAACEMADAPVAFLLEPSGREFVSTAMSGIEMAPVTIQPRPDTTGRAFTARESYFVADARTHPALAAAAGRRDQRRARRCSSRCCATARSAAC